LDRIDLALLLFDPGNHSEPLRGVQYWLRALDVPNEQPCPKILVAARADRAASLLTNSELQKFCEQNGVTGGFVATSAITVKAWTPWSREWPLQSPGSPWRQP
jgi:hypothetical protein